MTTTLDDILYKYVYEMFNDGQKEKLKKSILLWIEKEIVPNEVINTCDDDNISGWNDCRTQMLERLRK